MNFVEDPDLVIINSVVFDGLLSKIFAKAIHDFDFLKVDTHTAGGTTWDIVNLIGLEGDLDSSKAVEDRHHGVPAWLCDAVHYGTTPEVDSDVALRDLMNSAHNHDGHENKPAQYQCS